MAELLVLGSGGFGTALSVMLCNAGHKVTLWGWSKDENDALRERRENVALLKGVSIPQAVRIVDDVEAAASAEAVIIATPTVGVRNAARLLSGRLPAGAVVACVSKGLEPGSLKLLCDVIGEELPGNPVVSLSGPSHAEEVARGVPTAIVAASRSPEAAQRIQDLTAGTHVRIYTSDDQTGVQLGGALKNVIAFAAGIVDGMGLGDNTKAALMTRGLTEIGRLGAAMGARSETFAGLSGVGDLIVTCCSVHSRNRRCGLYVGEGLSVQQAVEKVGMTVEGITATLCAHALARRMGIEMPITEQIFRLVEGEIDARQAVRALLGRPLRHESESSWLQGRGE